MSAIKKDMYPRLKKIFDREYEISLCRKDEIDEVVRFIDQYWKKDHILVQSRILMDWQYFNTEKNAYHFIIARLRKTGEIHAIEGFIPTTQFDSSIRTPMTWGAIWKTIPNIAPPGLGMIVKQFREHEFETPYCCEIGISPDAYVYNKSIGNTVYQLNSWYMLNPDLNTFHLADGTIGIKKTPSVSSGICCRSIDENQWEEQIKGVPVPPFKSARYYINRYFRHPYYRYRGLLLLDEDNRRKEVLIYRVLIHEGSKCIFIVDYAGDGSVLAKAGSAMVDLLRENKAEYILFLNYGISDDVMQRAGFVCRLDDDIIIPVYYEPFCKTNVEIKCATRKEEMNWMSFKGDADQDRPNIMIPAAEECPGITEIRGIFSNGENRE